MQLYRKLHTTDSAGSSTSSSQSSPTAPPPPTTTTTPSPPTATTPSPPTATATEVETQTLAAGEPTRRYRNYSITFKLHVANFARQNSIRLAASKYGLDRKVVRAWVNNNETFLTQNRIQTRCRVSRSDLCQYPQMESELYTWIVDQRDSGHCVTGGMIRAEALRIL